jgi:squalene-associated FAD-dependent desaturase
LIDAIVIGGGFAGLSAATALAAAGARVLVLEARPALGGRASAFRDPATGERIDNGQHVLAGCYDEALAFLRRIGSLSGLHRPSGLRVPMIDASGHATVLALPPLPSPFHLLAGVLAWDALSLAERLSLVRVARALTRPARPDETVRDWLTRHHQSARLCALFWEPLALAALNQSIDQASADMFIAVVSRMFGANPEAASLLLPAVPLDDLYTHPARAYLESRGSRVLANAPARVLFKHGRAHGAVVRDEIFAAPVVIAAVPWFAFADATPDAPAALAATRQQAAALGSSPIVTVNAWFDRPVLDEMMLGLPGRTFQWAFDKRRLVGASQSHVSMVSSGADAICAKPNDELTTLAVDELTAAVPAVSRAALRHVSVVRERRATFALAPGGPSRPPTVTEVPGLLLAGDWIATGLPATIEGAVVSGHAAARAASG